MSLNGKHALITGSSHGIGRGIALKLTSSGAKVAIHFYQNDAAQMPRLNSRAPLPETEIAEDHTDETCQNHRTDWGCLTDSSLTCAPIVNTSIKRDKRKIHPMAEKQSCPGEMETGGMKCTLTGATVDEKGVLHCDYECTVVPKPQKAELNSLGARAQAVAAGLNVKDPASVQWVNAELKKIHADLKAFAKARNLKLVTKKYTDATSVKTAR